MPPQEKIEEEKIEEEKIEQEKIEQEKIEVKTLIKALEIIHDETRGDEGVASILRTINNNRSEKIGQGEKEKIEKWISNSKTGNAENSRKVAKLMVWYIANICLEIDTKKIKTTATVSFTDHKS